MVLHYTGAEPDPQNPERSDRNSWFDRIIGAGIIASALITVIEIKNNSF
jgi:hypothetical protein